jgi:hypothetical protein
VETYDVELTGIAPVKFNKPTAEAIKGLNPGSKAQKREDAAGREDEALQRLYMVDGQIAAPARQIKRAILDGASMGTIKIGRKGAIGYLKATLMVTDGVFAVLKGDELVGVKQPDRIVEDVVRIPPRTGALVLKAWPMLDVGWRLLFEVTLLQPAVLGQSVARAALDAAGLLSGLGTERPEYGRFTVTRWDRL